MIRQYPLTPSVGKRLIAKALTHHPLVTRTLRGGRLVIVAGTTNGYVAEEILAHIGQSVGFSRRHFFRGMTIPPARITGASGRFPDNSGFPGDVVIDKGVWKRAKTIFEVADDLSADDLILKGANALDLASGHAANFIDHSDAGPMAAVLPAVLGRRAKLIIPVGLEKRVSGNLLDLASRLSASDAKGPRLCPLPGQVFTEIDAIFLATGARATLVGAGGVGGAEGCVWLAVEGNDEQLGEVETLMRKIHAEPPFLVETENP
jgi:hypothetical protein